MSIASEKSKIGMLEKLKLPLQREDRGGKKRQSVNYVEILNSRRADEAIMALRRMVIRMNGEHRCQAVYRVHSDQAPELSGEKNKKNARKFGSV